MFHHYSDVLDNKLQLAIGIAGIVSGLCFQLLPRLPKIISIANYKTNPTVTEVESASLYYAITYLCYMLPGLYAIQSHDPLFFAFNLTGNVIYLAYFNITKSLPEDKIVRDESGWMGSYVFFFLACLVIIVFMTGAGSRTLLGVLATAFLAVVCVVKLGFETKDVGPVWSLVSSLVMMLNGAIWGGYGVLVKDVFICVSSGIGFGAGVAFLVLLCVNKNRNNNNTVVAPLGDNGDGIV